VNYRPSAIILDLSATSPTSVSACSFRLRLSPMADDLTIPIKSNNHQRLLEMIAL